MSFIFSVLLNRQPLPAAFAIIYLQKGAKAVKIYIDVLIVTNTLLTSLLLKCISCLLHTKITGRRGAIASIIGGAASLLALMIPENRFEALILTVIKLIVSAIIPAIAFKAKKAQDLLKLFFMYLSASIVFAGVCVLIWKTGSARVIYINALTVYFDLSLGVLALSATGSYLLLWGFELIQRKNAFTHKSYHLLIKIENLELLIPAVADTGNTLSDFFSGLPVVIICSDELYDHFELDREEALFDKGFHLIPYKTINGDGVLSVTTNATLTLIDNDKNHKAIEAAAGITLSSGPSRAIFNPCLAV